MAKYLFLISLIIGLFLIGCDDDEPDINNPVTGDFTYVIDQKVGGDSWEWGRGITSIPSGGYLVTGWTDSYGTGRNDLYLIRIDNSGTIVWENNFGGTMNNSDDYGESVILTSDGNILAAGGSNAFGAEYQFYLVKTDMDGDLLWETTVGSMTYESRSKVFELADGFLIGGNTGSYLSEQYHLLKTNDSGQLIWDSTYQYASQAQFRSMTATSDDGFVICGSYLLKIDSDGNTVWQNDSYLSSDPNVNEMLNDIIETTDNSLLAAGGQSVPSTSYTDPLNLFVVKLNSGGTLAWANQYDFEVSSWTTQVVENPDGSYSVLASNPDNNNLFMVKLDSDGNLTDTLTTEITGSPFDMINGHSGYALTGFTDQTTVDTTTDAGSVLIVEMVEQ